MSRLFGSLLRALCCARLCASLAPNLLPCVDLLTRAAATARSSPSRPDAREVTAALAELSNAGAHPESWAAALESDDRSCWSPVFSAKPEALKTAMKAARAGGGADASNAASGKYLSVPGGQTFRWAADGGEFSNKVRVFGGALELSFAGSFSMVGRRMTLIFQRLRVRLFWLLKLPQLDIREGSGIRSILERIRGGAKTATGFRKRPSVYAWCYADERICIAQGSSGSVALWSRRPSPA